VTDLASRRTLFWDINEKDIPQVLVTSDEWIIARVFQYGTLKDIFAVIDLYGKERTSKILSHLQLPTVASAMAYVYLGVDRYGKYGS
jgi:hypothetical protein